MNNIVDKKQRVLNFLHSHPGLFSEEEKNFILEYLFYSNEFIPNIARQVYDELGLLSDDNNLYLGFLNLLQGIHNIEDKHILEVGGGVIPRLGKRILKLQNKGLITIYDPKLNSYEKSTSKFILKREKFHSNTDVSEADLLVGLMPCEAAFDIVDSATKNRKDFVIALCEGGYHGDFFDYYEDEDEWMNSLLIFARRRAERYDIGKIKTKSLDKYYDPYPVIYNER